MADEPAPRARLILVRHAQTEWSVAGRHTGRTDIPLTEAGREAARRLQPRLHDHPWAAVLCSPLSRARETCALAGLGQAAEIREELLEWDYGEYEGLTTAEIRTRLPHWSLWRDGCPGGESVVDVGRRVQRLLAGLTEPQADVVLFSHGHLLRVLTACWLELGPEQGARFALSTGAVCELGCERETRVVWRWNDAGP